MKPFLILFGLALLPWSILSAQTPGYFGTSRAPGASAAPTITPIPTAPTPPVAAATPITPAPSPALLPRSHILTEDDFRAFLIGTTWQWRGPGLSGTDTLNFYADGTARNSGGWTAKCVIKSVTEIQLQIGRATAKMTFDPSYTRYDGIDFNRNLPLGSQRKK